MYLIFATEEQHTCWLLNNNCLVSLFSDADCYNSSSPYTGKMICTVSGRTCQNWNTQYPHIHEYILGPDDQNSSYCRNPDGQTGVPWCLTTDPDVRYEYCWVSKC